MAAAASGVEAAREFEIKLEFDPADRHLIESHPLLAGAAREKQTLVSVYFDTEDQSLRKAQLVLRVRKSGSRYVQAIKGMDGVSQLFDRPEWERETQGLTPDLDHIAETPLGAILDGHAHESLRPLFRTRIERAVFLVPSNETKIEIAIDEGEIEAETRWSPVHEVELELKEGDSAELFKFARSLAASIPLRLAVKTKAERGYELAGQEEEGAEKAKPIALDADMDCASAFRAIAENCLRQIVANERVVGAHETEGLHQMRVGLRRLRAAIDLFAKMTDDCERDRIKAELKWITNELGPARDLDVIAADILKPLAKDGDHAETHRAIAAARAKAYASAAGSIASDRFRAALLDVAEWIEVGPWTRDEGLAKRRERRVAKHAAKRLANMRNFVRDKGEDLRALDAKRRHKLRIKAKTLRYAIEFFASLFPNGEKAKRREAQLSALKDLQDELGALNDFAQREALARKALEEGDAVLPPRVAKLLAVNDTDIDKRLKRAEEAYADFAKAKSFWN